MTLNDQWWWGLGGKPGPAEWKPSTYQINGSWLYDAPGGVVTMNTSYVKSHTPNSTKGTFSFWIRRVGRPGLAQTIFRCNNTDASSFTNVVFTSSGNFEVVDTATGLSFLSSKLFLDCAQWYHFVIEVDTAMATAADRVKIYAHGQRLAADGTPTYPAQNSTLAFMTQNTELILDYADNLSAKVAGFIWTESAQDASKFGEEDGLGNWRPKAPAVTWGPNDAYWNCPTEGLIAADSSGNGNDINITSGNSNKSSLSVAYTNRYQYDSPTSVRPQFSYINAEATRVDHGGMRSYRTTGLDYAYSTHGFTFGGAWRVEFQANSVSSRNGQAGTKKSLMDASNGDGFWWRQAHGDAGETLGYRFDAQYPSYGVRGSSNEANGSDDAAACLTGFRYFSWGASSAVTWMSDETLATPIINLSDTSNKRFCQIELDDGNLAEVTDPGYWDIYQLGHRFYSNPNTNTYVMSNFGSAPFWRSEGDFPYGPFSPPKSDGHVYDQPVYDGKYYSGVVAAPGANILAEAQAACGADGLIIIKDRENATPAQVIDSKRGFNNALLLNSTAGQTTYTAPTGNSIAVWWKEVDDYANGFQIVEYTGNGSDEQVIPHSLNRRPHMIWIKAKTATSDWAVWYSMLGTDGVVRPTNADASRLNNPATAGGTFRGTSGVTNGLTFTSFKVGTTNSDKTNTNASGVQYVAYVWAPCEGYCNHIRGTISSTYESDSGRCLNNNQYETYMGFKPEFLLHFGPGGTSTSRYCYLQARETAQVNEGACTNYFVDLFGANTQVSSTGWYWGANGVFNRNPNLSNFPEFIGQSNYITGWAATPLWGKSCSPATIV